MTDREILIDNYIRAIKISLSGKSDEAQNGAFAVIQDLLRFSHALKKEDQTYGAMQEMLIRLKKETHIGKTA